MATTTVPFVAPPTRIPGGNMGKELITPPPPNDFLFYSFFTKLIIAKNHPRFTQRPHNNTKSTHLPAPRRSDPLAPTPAHPPSRAPRSYRGAGLRPAAAAAPAIGPARGGRTEGAERA